jgi:hypothetical protein
MTRYSVFPLHVPIHAGAVRGEVNKGYMTIVAPKVI